MDPSLASDIRSAFQAGNLFVESSTPLGDIVLVPVEDVLQHHVPEKTCYKILLEDDSLVIVTEDHSLFQIVGSVLEEVRAEQLKVGDRIACKGSDGKVGEKEIAFVSMVRTPEAMYDLSVPPFQNFVLADGIVAHNSYSIGGISLDIEKSSKYESLKQNAEQQADKAAEAKLNTTFFIRGLQQPRFGMGVRSSFGPSLGGRGILSPRSFVAGFAIFLTHAACF